MVQAALPHTPSQDEALTRELTRILRLIADGRWRDAAYALNAVQRRAPMDARVPLVGMRLAQKVGNVQGAVQTAQRAVQLAPGWHVAHIELAQALLAAGQGQKAMDAAREAVRLAGRDAPVLLRAAAIGEQVREQDDVLDWVAQALALLPAGSRVHTRLLLVQGNESLKRRRTGQARAAFDAVLAGAASEAQDVELAQRGLVQVELGEDNKAAAIALLEPLRAKYPDDGDLAHSWELAHGRTPSTQPPLAMRALFDAYAETFDVHLVRGLHYDAPRRVADILRAIYPDRRFNLLDLACGTGLLGVYLGPIKGHMIGVDLSPKMLEQAARHRLYTRFHQVNVLDALRETPAAHYEVICCLDALIYIGDLHPVVPGASRILKDGGHFITTYERAQEDEEGDMVLRESRRYAHKESFVVALHKANGFGEVRVIDLPQLRSENQKPLPGFIVVARKGPPPAAPITPPAAPAASDAAPAAQ